MSELLDPPVATALSDALAGLHEAVDRVVEICRPGVEGELWALTSAELLEAAATMHVLGNRADAAVHGLVREIDSRGAAVEAGAPSTAAWLRGRLHLHPGAAKRLVETARSLHRDPAGSLVRHAEPEGSGDTDDGRPLLRAAFASGTIGAEHASFACQALSELGPDVGREVVAQAEAFLAGQAVLHDPKALGHLGRHLRHVLDPDAGDSLAEDEEHAVATRTLEIRERRDGSSDLRGRLDPELTARLRSQLNPLAAPRPTTDGAPDPRTTGRRNADALAELLRRYTAADLSPTQHGATATVTVTMALETLERRLGSTAARLDWSGPVSAETARRLACTARLIPVVLGADGEPLDVGRASYPVTQAIWRGLVARDGGCSFHGCDRPPEWTEAHHRTRWEDGGETSVANCCLLCDHHHRQVHHHGWEALLIDGVIHVVPPPWIDPDQVPRPNTNPARLSTLSSLPEPPEKPPD